MIKTLLYFIVLMALIPLDSSGKIKLRAKRHISEISHAATDPLNKSLGSDGSMEVMMPYMPFQDSLNTGRRKRIKEVAKAKPQSKPERIDERDPNNRPANPDPGNVRRPPAERPSARPQGGRPTGGSGGGVRPQAPPPRRGR